MVFRFKMSSVFLHCTKGLFKNISSFRFISSSTKLVINTTVDAEEVKKFDSTANQWWHGKQYELLHASNAMRVPLIRDGVLSVNKCYKKVCNPLEGFSILDVGCGGGILAESLARLGAKVTGLDPGTQNVQAAIEHSLKDPDLKDNLSYVCDTVENLVTKATKYDVIVCSEVVEHVSDVHTFVQSCVELTKNEGSLFFTTINQTYLSYVLSIVMAEYVLGLVPKKTHEWNKFVKPEDLSHILESLNCSIISLEGMMYNPITKNFSWSKNTDNWYAVHAVKQ